MQTALRQLLSDLLSVIVFLVIYGVTDNLYLATGLAVAVSVSQVVIARVRRQPVDAMQWLIFGLVIALGAATLITQDSRFIMFKPSIIHFAIGAVMLRRGWMLRYLPPIARDNLSTGFVDAAGYAWAALMIALGLINILIASAFDFRVWALFITFGAIGAKLVAFLIQYVVMRTLVRRKLQSQPAV
jgi:intracellular septation protein A